MIKIQYLDKYIEESLSKADADRSAKHTPSGKLSASRLGWPLQWQVLKAVGVPQEPLGEYVVRKFLRGRHIEDWLRETTPGLVAKEKFVEYRDVVGYIDALVYMDGWNIPGVKGVIPHEIKSVTNAGFKWIVRDGYKKGHALQGALYALAEGSEYFVIDYVASDDYRVLSFLLKTEDFKEEVDGIIDAYEKQVETGWIPEFKSVEKWQENTKYNNYSEFVTAGPIEIDDILMKKYPESYKKLKKETE